MKKIIVIAVLAISAMCQAQSKNFIDQPLIEISGFADTLVLPNEIYIEISLSERDTKDKVSIEELESRMVKALKDLGIDTEKALSAKGMTSMFQYYLLRKKDVIKNKIYTLKVEDAQMASKVFLGLEEVGISNANIERVDHSDMKGLRNRMRSKAVIDAQDRAVLMTTSLNQAIGPAIHIIEDEGPANQLQGKLAGIQIRGIGAVNNQVELPRIEFEKIRVSANVRAVFILKEGVARR